MTNSNVIAYDAGIIICNMEHAVVLDIAVATYLNAVYVAANGYTGPYTGIFFDFYLADEGSSIKSISLFIDFGSLSFEFKNHFHSPLSQKS